MYSKEFHEGVTATFHFTNTIRSATLALAAEVEKLVDAGADDRVLEALYAVPGGTGQNLRVFVQMAGAEQEAAIAETWLFSVVGRFEVWADSLPVTGAARGSQFPSRGSTALATGVGYAEVFDRLTPCDSMESAYRSSIGADHRVLPRNRVDDALAIFRLFKECRNASAHSGGVADDRVAGWAAIAARDAADLFVDAGSSAVALPGVGAGDRITLTLRQVRAFVAVAMRIAYTVDAALLVSDVGLTTVTERWRSQHGQRSVRVSLKALDRGQWVRARLAAASIAVPDEPRDAIDLLRGEDLIRMVT